MGKRRITRGIPINPKRICLKGYLGGCGAGRQIKGYCARCLRDESLGIYIFNPWETDMVPSTPVVGREPFVRISIVTNIAKTNGHSNVFVPIV